MPSVAIAIFPGVQALDVAGPLDVFAEANLFIDGKDRYEVALLAADSEPLRASNGIRLVADETFDQQRSTFDLALIAGGPALPESTPDARLTAWLANVASQCERYGSICTGAFALGHAGLLDDRNVTLDHGKITAIDAGADVAASPGTTVIDLRGRTVMPGLVGKIGRAHV